MRRVQRVKRRVQRVRDEALRAKGEEERVKGEEERVKGEFERQVDYLHHNRCLIFLRLFSIDNRWSS